MSTTSEIQIGCRSPHCDCGPTDCANARAAKAAAEAQQGIANSARVTQVGPVTRDAWVARVAASDGALGGALGGGASCQSSKDTNPKDAAGDKRVPLALQSPIASAHWALAQYAGMLKYQAWNWRVAGVRSSVYLSAMKRHIDAYISGEEFDPVDGTHHLGNVMACAAIILDAEAAGKLTDDRPPIVGIRETYKFLEVKMAELRERYKHIEQHPYTISGQL
jgi:hypothetical protein